MSLGKRPRPSMMRRTASLTEFAPEFLADGGEAQPRPNQEATPHPHHHHHSRERARSEAAAAAAAGAAGAHRAYGGAGAEWLEARLAGGIPSPRRSAGGNRRSSCDFAAVETAPFLRACGLCRRRLAPGRDIFMYRGDIAFCSLECRQQQINQDERKEKCSLTSMKEAPPSTTGSEQSSNGETVAAA